MLQEKVEVVPLISVVFAEIIMRQGRLKIATLPAVLPMLVLLIQPIKALLAMKLHQQPTATIFSTAIRPIKQQEPEQLQKRQQK